MNDSPLRRLLERIADLTIIGLLTAVTGLTVLFGLTGLTAAAATLAGRRPHGSLPSQFVDGVRRSWRPTLGLQIGWLLVLAVGGVDVAVALDWAFRGSHQLLVAPALACGVLLLAAAAVMPTYLAVAEALIPDSALGTLRRAATMACGLPAATMTIGGTALVFTAIAWTVPLLTPLLIGTHVLIGLATVTAAVRRATGRMRPESRAAWLTRPPSSTAHEMVPSFNTSARARRI